MAKNEDTTTNFKAFSDNLIKEFYTLKITNKLESFTSCTSSYVLDILLFRGNWMVKDVVTPRLAIDRINNNRGSRFKLTVWQSGFLLE